ncbi:MAG: hypothetical protein K6L76_09935 [Agarilytica sp.]
MESIAAKKTTSDTADIQQHLLDAQAGEPHARQYINAVAAPYINYQNDRFCRRFCQGSYRNVRCTLSPPQGASPANSALCDKANAGYGWMLEELTNEKRLKKIEAKSEAQLAAYFKTLANSLPFYERWKNWRFDRRVHVPQYICDIDPYAKTIFLSLRSENNFRMIAQQHGMSENRVREVADQIIIELSERKRLYLLNPPKIQSLNSDDNSDDPESNGPERDIADKQYSPESLLQSEELRQAWSQMSDLEQFVIEALVIEQQDANIVLQTLKAHSIPLGKNKQAEKNDRQQLYYFKRKALDKLHNHLTNKK